MKSATYAVLTTLTLSGTLQAASFDCTKAGNRIEHMICDNQAVSDLDSELATVYKMAIVSGDGKTIRNEQRAWLKSRNSATTLDELASSYRLRLEQLKTSSPAPVAAETNRVEPKAEPEVNKENTTLVIDENGKRTRLTDKEFDEYLKENNNTHMWENDPVTKERVFEHTGYAQARQKAEYESADGQMSRTALGFAGVDYCVNAGLMVGLDDYVKKEKASSLSELKTKIGDQYDSKKMQVFYKQHMTGVVQLMVNTGDIYAMCSGMANQGRADIGAEDQF